MQSDFFAPSKARPVMPSGLSPKEQLAWVKEHCAWMRDAPPKEESHGR